jgi:hypothetical protein
MMPTGGQICIRVQQHYAVCAHEVQQNHRHTAGYPRHAVYQHSRVRVRFRVRVRVRFRVRV